MYYSPYNTDLTINFTVENLVPVSSRFLASPSPPFSRPAQQHLLITKLPRTTFTCRCSKDDLQEPADASSTVSGSQRVQVTINNTKKRKTINLNNPLVSGGGGYGWQRGGSGSGGAFADPPPKPEQ
jgi:hypothetical protein